VSPANTPHGVRTGAKGATILDSGSDAVRGLLARETSLT